MLAKPGGVERGGQEIARAVAGEDAAGPVRAVRRGRQADQQQARVRIAEPRHRPAPVDVVAVGGLLLARDARAVAPQARAVLAGDDRRADGQARGGPANGWPVARRLSAAS